MEAQRKALQKLDENLDIVFNPFIKEYQVIEYFSGANLKVVSPYRLTLFGVIDDCPIFRLHRNGRLVISFKHLPSPNNITKMIARRGTQAYNNNFENALDEYETTEKMVEIKEAEERRYMARDLANHVTGLHVAVPKEFRK